MAFPACIDSSGNGNNGLFNPVGDGGFDPGNGTIGAATGLVAGDGATVATTTFSPASPGGESLAGGSIGAGGSTLSTYPPGNYYLRGWAAGDVVLNGGEVACFYESSAGLTGNNLFISPSINEMLATRLYTNTGPSGQETVTLTGLSLPTTGTHQYAVTYNQSMATFTFYVDGASVGTKTGNGARNDGVTFPAFIPDSWRLGQINTTGGSTYDEVDFGNTLITGGQMASDYAAAATSFSAYVSAVLSRSPVGFYHLDEFGGAPPTPVTFDLPALFVPHKTNEHSANWRAIEAWAQQVRDILGP